MLVKREWNYMLPEILTTQLHHYGIKECEEVALREALEQYAETYTLVRLAPRAARRWKCHYRLLMSDTMYDAQTASEAYALGLLAVLQQAPREPNIQP
jgi:hypothetical protein